MGIDRIGNFDSGGGKDADESGRSEHERKAEAVVVAAQPVGDLPVISVQVERGGRLVRYSVLLRLSGSPAGWLHNVRHSGRRARGGGVARPERRPGYRGEIHAAIGNGVNGVK